MNTLGQKGLMVLGVAFLAASCGLRQRSPYEVNSQAGVATGEEMPGPGHAAAAELVSTEYSCSGVRVIAESKSVVLVSACEKRALVGTDSAGRPFVLDTVLAGASAELPPEYSLLCWPLQDLLGLTKLPSEQRAGESTGWYQPWEGPSGIDEHEYNRVATAMRYPRIGRHRTLNIDLSPEQVAFRQFRIKEGLQVNCARLSDRSARPILYACEELSGHAPPYRLEVCPDLLSLEW